VETLIFKKKKPTKEDKLQLCDGIKVHQHLYDIKENRLWTLIFKGIIVYLMSAGTVLGYVSATGIKYNGVVLNLVLFLCAIYLSCIYYNKKTENFGNILILLVILAVGMGGSLYINSGFYSVLNDLNVFAKEFFEFSGIRTYTEPINDRYMAVNVSMGFIGVVLTLLYNMWVLKKMMYIDALILGVTFCMIPVYVQREPDIIYLVMLITGCMLGFIFKKAGFAYKIDSDSVYIMEEPKIKKGIIFRGKKDSNDKKISGIYSIKTFVTIGVHIFAVTMLVAIFMQVIVPKKTYYQHDEDNKKDELRISSIKKENMDQVGNFWQSGLMGIMNRYSHVGGMNSGALGGISNVNLDYNTDFILTMAPYSYDTLYLKERHYGNYIPYRNYWEGAEISIGQDADKQYAEGQSDNEEIIEKQDDEEENDNENDNKDNKVNRLIYGNVLKEAYDEGYKYSSKAKLDIENVAIGMLDFTPYYTEENMGKITRIREKTTFEYYPKLKKNNKKIEGSIDKNKWLTYSLANSKTLKKFCDNVGLKQGMEADVMVGKISEYFQANYPYTLNPGGLERGKDFITDFLENKKKGYCVHFATTATLALRYMGVPARYVEGYAVSYENMLNNSLMDITKKFQEYYDGYSELEQTAVIDVKVSDASAHAWVEIYDDDYGWKVIEVTPSAQEEERSAFWSRFMNIFREDNGEDGQETTDLTIGQRETEDFITSDFVKGLIYILLTILIIFAIIKLKQLIAYKLKYYKAGINDKLIMEYSKYLKKKRRKYAELRTKMNYKEQIEWLVENQILIFDGVETNVVIDILDRAGFGKNEIAQDEYVKVRSLLH